MLDHLPLIRVVMYLMLVILPMVAMMVVVALMVALMAMMVAMMVEPRFHHPLNAPEVKRFTAIRDVSIRHVEEAVVTPIISPRVSHNENFPAVIVTDCTDGMTT